MLNELNIVSIDCETTGLDHTQHEIIQLAAVVYSPTEDKIINEWSKKVKPLNISISDPKALEINQYNQKSHEYTHDIKDAILEFNDLIKYSIVLGQNLDFDIRFVTKYYKLFNLPYEVHRHRKLELTSIAWPIINSKVKDLSLNTICAEFGVSNEGAHDALIDCQRVLTVYRKIMEQYGVLTKI